MENISITAMLPSLGFSIIFLWLWFQDKKEVKEREAKSEAARQKAELRSDELAKAVLVKFEENAKSNQQVASVIESNNIVTANNTEATKINTETTKMFVSVVNNIIRSK